MREDIDKDHLIPVPQPQMLQQSQLPNLPHRIRLERTRRFLHPHGLVAAPAGYVVDCEVEFHPVLDEQVEGLLLYGREGTDRRRREVLGGR